MGRSKLDVMTSSKPTGERGSFLDPCRTDWIGTSVQEGVCSVGAYFVTLILITGCVTTGREPTSSSLETSEGRSCWRECERDRRDCEYHCPGGVLSLSLERSVCVGACQSSYDNCQETCDSSGSSTGYNAPIGSQSQFQDYSTCESSCRARYSQYYSWCWGEMEAFHAARGNASNNCAEGKVRRCLEGCDFGRLDGHILSRCFVLTGGTVVRGEQASEDAEFYIVNSSQGQVRIRKSDLARIDTVTHFFLTGGTTVQGRLVGEDSQFFLVNTAQGLVRIRRSDIGGTDC